VLLRCHLVVRVAVGLDAVVTASQLRARYLALMLGRHHADEMIVLWRQWRAKVTR
jgi:hypothetical protein